MAGSGVDGKIEKVFMYFFIYYINNMCTASNIQKNIYEYRISLSFFFDIYMKIKFIMRKYSKTIPIWFMDGKKAFGQWDFIYEQW